MAAAHRIETGGDLIQDQQLRFPEECLGDAETLQHPLGEGAEPAALMLLQADLL